MKLNERITSLESELATANTERDQARTDLATAQQERDQARADLATRTTERDTARTDLEAARSELTTANTERDQARADLDKERKGADEKIQAGIRQGIASAGVPPVRRVDTPDPANPKAENSGSPRERLAASFNAQVAKK